MLLFLRVSFEHSAQNGSDGVVVQGGFIADFLPVHIIFSRFHHVQRALIRPCLRAPAEGNGQADVHQFTLFNVLAQALDQCLRLFLAGPGQQDDKLVPAQPGHRVAGPERVLKRLGDHLDHLVAAIMAKGVIEGFQPVDIRVQEG